MLTSDKDRGMSNRDSFSPARRRFLIGLGSFGLLMAVWEMGRGTLRFLNPPLTQPQPKPVVAGPPNEFGLNTLTYIPEARAWLGHDDDGYFAMSAICPHLGCTIQQVETMFACPCHGSQFDRQGNVLNGPATTPMNYLAVDLIESLLMIKPNQTVSAETRLRGTL
jgi:cytochrome b6-f complex iron-sulfur subunit